MTSNLRDSTIVAKAKGRRPLTKPRLLTSPHSINYRKTVIDFELSNLIAIENDESKTNDHRSLFETTTPLLLSEAPEAPRVPQARDREIKNSLKIADRGSLSSDEEEAKPTCEITRQLAPSLSNKKTIIIPNINLAIDYEDIFNENSVSIEYLADRGSLSSDEEEAKPTCEITRQLAPLKAIIKFEPRIITRDHKMTQEDWDDWNNHRAVFDDSIKPKAAIKGQRLRGICFTLNNYTLVDQKNLRDRFDAGMFTYLVFGREVGANGTPHLQGYAHFSKQLSFDQMKVLINERAHLEYARADRDKFASRWLYCMKDGDFEEFGTQPQHGGQLKKQTMMDLIKDGKTLLEIRELMPQAFFHNKNKCVDWFDDELKMKPEPMHLSKFYLLKASEGLTVYDLISYHFPDHYFAFVTNLSQLERYADIKGYIKNVCYINPDDITEAEGWSYGSKILYKHGYKYNEILCDNMVIYHPYISKRQLLKYKHLKKRKEEDPLVELSLDDPDDEEKRLVEEKRLAELSLDDSGDGSQNSA